MPFFNVAQRQAFILALFLAIVQLYNSLRNRCKVTRSGVKKPKQSAWVHLYAHGDDATFTDIVGFNRQTFNELEHVLFADEDHHMFGRKCGRPSALGHHAQLGLLLLYLNSIMHYKHLCLIFGIVPSCVTTYINKMLQLVKRRLQHHPASQVQFPDAQTMAFYADLINIREPAVNNVVAFVDGVSIPVECSSDPTEQSAYYNKYHRDTMVNNVFAFAPTGKIIHAAINFPGSWHDTMVCHNLIDQVVRKIGQYAMCVDMGFPRYGELFERFVGPLSRRMRANLAPGIRGLMLRLHNLYTSLRQSSEWGMRGLQGTFCRLKSRLTSNKAKRHAIIISIVLLHNFRTHHMGLNQIATVFNPRYEQYINLGAYDRIANYFEVEEENDEEDIAA